MSMNTSSSVGYVSAGDIFGAVWRFVVAAAKVFAEGSAERRAIRHLSELTDAQLRDIGIHRSQIHSVVRNGRPGVA